MVRVIPIERLNALLIITTQAKYLEIARGWVEKLDQLGGTSGGSRFFVYSVRNGRAENLATLISDLFSTARRSTTVTPGLAPGSRPTEIRSQAFGTPSEWLAAKAAPPHQGAQKVAENRFENVGTKRFWIGDHWEDDFVFELALG